MLVATRTKMFTCVRLHHALISEAHIHGVVIGVFVQVPLAHWASRRELVRQNVAHGSQQPHRVQHELSLVHPLFASLPGLAQVHHAPDVQLLAYLWRVELRRPEDAAVSQLQIAFDAGQIAEIVALWGVFVSRRDAVLVLQVGSSGCRAILTAVRRGCLIGAAIGGAIGSAICRTIIRSSSARRNAVFSSARHGVLPVSGDRCQNTCHARVSPCTSSVRASVCAIWHGGNSCARIARLFERNFVYNGCVRCKTVLTAEQR